MNRFIEKFLKHSFRIRHKFKLTATNNNIIYLIKNIFINNFKVQNQGSFEVLLNVKNKNNLLIEIIEILNQFSLRFKIYTDDSNTIKKYEKYVLKKKDLKHNNFKFVISSEFSTSLNNIFSLKKTLFLFYPSNILRNKIINSRYYADHIFFMEPFKKNIFKKIYNKSFHYDLFPHRKNFIDTSNDDFHINLAFAIEDDILLSDIKKIIKDINLENPNKKINFFIILKSKKIVNYKIPRTIFIQFNDKDLNKIASKFNYLILFQTNAESLSLINLINFSFCKIIIPDCTILDFLPFRNLIKLKIGNVTRNNYTSIFSLDILSLQNYIKTNINKIKLPAFDFNKYTLRNSLIDILIYEGLIKKNYNFMNDLYFEKLSNIEVYLSTSNRYEFFAETLENILKHKLNSIHNININIFIDTIKDNRYFDIIKKYNFRYIINNQPLGLPYLMRFIKFDCLNRSARIEKKIDFICYIQDDCLIKNEHNYFDDMVEIYNLLSEKDKIAFISGFVNDIHPGYKSIDLSRYKLRLSNTIDGKNFFVHFKKFQLIANTPYYNKVFKKNGNPGPNRGSNFDIWLWKESSLKSHTNIIAPNYIEINKLSKDPNYSTWGNSEKEEIINKRILEGRVYK